MQHGAFLLQQKKGTTSHSDLTLNNEEVFPSKKIVDHMIKLGLTGKIFLTDDDKAVINFSEQFSKLTSYDYNVLNNILRLATIENILETNPTYFESIENIASFEASTGWRYK